MKKKVEIAIRVDGQESFYVLPEGEWLDPPSQDFCHSLECEVEAIIRATTNVQKTEWNIIRLLVATASTRRVDPNVKLEITIDDDKQPAIVNPETGEVTRL
jgi:hypothetical protein